MIKKQTLAYIRCGIDVGISLVLTLYSVHVKQVQLLAVTYFTLSSYLQKLQHRIELAFLYHAYNTSPARYPLENAQVILYPPV